MKNYIATFILAFFVSGLLAQVDLQKLDAYFAKAQKDWNIPGMAVGIIKDGEVIMSKGYGILENGKSTAVDGNSLFAIASNTKAFVAAALAILVDEGKINWDDPVRKHLPYFQLYDDYSSNHTTVRDLLCHRVGLGTFSGDLMWYKSDFSAEEVVRKIKYVPQAYDFRAGYGYSNLMFITAGEVIEAVSGKSWAAFTREHFFQPLKMNRTITSTNDLEEMKNIATPHKPIEEENKPIAWVNWDNMGAAGGIISSANDMLKWIQLQIDGGQLNNKSIFSRDRQIDMWTPHNNYRLNENARETFPTRHFNGYGLGWGVFDYGGRFAASHSGGYDGMYSRVAIMPEENLGIVVLTNSMKSVSGAIMYYTFDHILGLPERDWSSYGLKDHKVALQNHQARLESYQEARIPGTQPTHDLQDYAGTYEGDLHGPIEIRYEDGDLQLHFSRAPHLEARLSHWHHNTFEILWTEEHAWFDFGTLQFTLNNKGDIHGLEFDVPNYDIFFHELNAVKQD